MSGPHKILLLDTGREWGGGTNSMMELLKRMDRKRFAVTALFYHNYRKGGDSDLRRELAKIDIDLLLLPQRPQPKWAKLGKELARGLLAWNRRLRGRAVFAIEHAWRIGPNARRIAQVLREGGYDLLYMNNQPSSNLEGLFAAETTGVPAVQHCRIETALNRAEIAALNRTARRIICVSQGVADSLIRQGVAAEKCIAVLNGIDGSQALPDPAPVRAALGLSDGEVVIGTAGSLIARKGVGDLLRAAGMVRQKTPTPFRLLIVGEGPQRGELERLAGELGLENAVIFAGFQKEPLPFIAAMDVFTLASAREGLPRVILEAMLLRKPVLASDVVGSRELVRHGVSGLLFPHGDATALAQNLLRLMEDPGLRAEMGRRGGEIVRREYTIERYVQGVEAVLSEEVSSRG